jgi:hypothetical protein
MVPYRPAVSFDDYSYDSPSRRGYGAQTKRDVPLPERLPRGGGGDDRISPSPYVRPSFDDNRNEFPSRRNHDSPRTEQRDPSFLPDRTRERDGEVGFLRRENRELQDQLRRAHATGGGGRDRSSTDLDVASAYEDLLAHLKQREGDFRSESAMHKERQRDLETEIRKLKDKAREMRKLLDEQEEHISSMERERERERHVSLIRKEADADLKGMRKQLDAAMKDKKEMHLQITELHAENVHGKQREIKDRENLAQLIERIDNHIRDQDDLERINEDLLRRLEMQRHLLCEKDDEIAYVERSHNEREVALNDDLDRMRNRLDEIAETQEKTLHDHEDMIRLLYEQIDRYKVIIDEADYVTHEQRSALLAKNNEIKSLSKVIERVKSAGLLSQLDNLFMCGPSSKRNSSAYTSLRDSAR